MKRASSFVAALAATLLAVSADAATVTTNILLCATSNDEAVAAANQAASGWTFSSPGTAAQAKEGSYYYPVKFVGGTVATSAAVASGSYMTNLVLGVKIGNVARTVTVTPYSSSGTAGTAQTKAPASTGSLIDMGFAFLPAENVSYVKISIVSSGNSTAYLYYATVTTETGSSGPAPLPAPTGLAASSVTDTGFTLTWNPDEHADGYVVEVLNSQNVVVGNLGIGWFGPISTDQLFDSSLPGPCFLSSDTDYTARVKATGSGDYADSDWAVLSVRTALADGLLRAPLLDEGFSGADNAWANTSASARPDDSETDCDGWSFSANVYNARSAIKIGQVGTEGWALSPEMTLSNEVTSASVSVSFSAAAYAGKSTKFSVSFVDLATGETNAIAALTNLAPAALGDASSTSWTGGTNYTASVAVPTRFKLLFETLSSGTDKRLLLDSIKVTQVYDPAYAVLAVPAGVGESDVGTHGFTVSWTAVANASGYEVWLDGAVAGSCASTDTSMQLTGLSDGTAYSVQVRALGDNLHYGDSPLSTAISVTTEEDAQNVVFTVTGAPAGDVFAGDSVSFTVAAQVEATGAAAPVNLSGIAGATFSNGVFSWTPSEAAVGTNVATFASGPYSTNVAISVVSVYKTESLETENFSQIKSTSWTSTTGYTNRIDGDIGTWTGSDIIKTKSAVIIGRRTSSGTIVSPAVDLKARTPGSFSVSFDTGSVPGAKASVQAQILDAADGTVLYTTNFPTVAALPADATAVSDAGARFTVAPGPSVVLPAAVKLAFTTYASAGDDSQRAYVDTVVFEQKISARIRDLPAPTGLAVAGEPGENGFAVGWTAVSDATNYAVRVTDADGEIVFSAPFCAATQATVAGLADDEIYAVQVRATGDEAVWYPSPWSDALAVRTARSSTHPTLSFGGWQNAVGDGKLYAGIANAAAVSAVRDNGTNAVVTLESVSPAPAVGPTFGNDVLAWTPVDADTNKTFTVSFLMDGVYATNLSFKILSVPPLQAPAVTVGDVSWKAFVLSWDEQDRAAGYGVRVWTDCPNPGATATHVDEAFAQWPAVRPFGWTFRVGSKAYGDATAPVKLEDDGHFMETYDLGGPVSSVSFHATGHSIANSSSTLTVVGIGADGTETVLAILGAADIGQTDAGIDRTLSVPAGTDVRKIAWRYAKDKGGVGVGSVAIGGEGFSTPRWLPGWGPAAKDVGLVQTCTVAKPRPGKATGVDPADKSKDLEEPRVNYAEVTARDVAGASLATVVPVGVPAPPRSVRATIMVLR